MWWFLNAIHLCWFCGTVCKQRKDLIFSKLNRQLFICCTSHFCLLLLHINTQVRSAILPCLPTLTFLHRASQTGCSQCSVHQQDHLCVFQLPEFQFPTQIYILFAFSFLLLHELIDWMIIPQRLTLLGVKHLDMFPFSACSQEPSYIVSGELHLPLSNLRLEIIQKLLTPRGGTSITALPPNLGFQLVSVI